MAGSLGDRLRRLKDDGDQWLHDQNGQASRSLAELEQAGRDAWNAATRAGVDLAGRTPQELRALGARVLNGQSSVVETPGSSGQAAGRQSATPGPVGIAKPSFIGDSTWNALMQADAAVRGATNAITFGGADHFAAAMNALAGGGVDGWYQRYKQDLAVEHARDQYDAANRAAAQMSGQIGGALLGIGLLAPEAPMLGLGARLPGAARLTGREAGTLLGAGAASGLAGQTASDMVTGRDPSLEDDAGAAVGGAANVAALPFGPGPAGAIGGWVTSAAQDLFNGRPIAWDRASESAMGAGLLGAWAGRVGTTAADGLPIAAKGKLGETLGDLRSTIGGQPREWGPKTRDYLPNGSYWYPDGVSGPVRFEDKFGYNAQLSPNQGQAQAVYGPDFKLFHFTPDDTGMIASVPGATLGQHAVNAPSSDPQTSGGWR